MIKSIKSLVSTLLGKAPEQRLEVQEVDSKGKKIAIEKSRDERTKGKQPAKARGPKADKESRSTKEPRADKPAKPSKPAQEKSADGKDQQGKVPRPTGPRNRKQPQKRDDNATRDATSDDTKDNRRDEKKQDTRGTRGPSNRQRNDRAAGPRNDRATGPRNDRATGPRKDRVTGPLIEDIVHEEWDYTPHMPPALDGKARFSDLELSSVILRAVHEIGYEYCTDIQSEVLPHSLKGLDAAGRAQTGTGKTATFLITIIQRLMTTKPIKERRHGAPRALIMAPTRELVMQIEQDAKDISKYSGARVLAIFGGIDYERQRNSLEGEYVDIMIATPGRMLDYHKQKLISLDRVEVLVLDEADRMLDMGFLPDMRRIINATPDKTERQTMLFSATLTPAINNLASLWTNAPITVEIEPDQITGENIEQIAYIISKGEKFIVLYNILQKFKNQKVIIFANRRDQVRKVATRLQAAGFKCGMLAGDVRQSRRIRTLKELRDNKLDILVATDVAGRGIHIDDIAVVFNYTLPDDPEDYVHRIGRTGRAGAKGMSIAFASEEDSYVLPTLEAYIKQTLTYITPDAELLKELPEDIAKKIEEEKDKRKRSKRSRPGDDRRGRGDSSRQYKKRSPQRDSSGDKKSGDDNRRRSRSMVQKPTNTDKKSDD